MGTFTWLKLLREELWQSIASKRDYNGWVYKCEGHGNGGIWDTLVQTQGFGGAVEIPFSTMKHNFLSILCSISISYQIFCGNQLSSLSYVGLFDISELVYETEEGLYEIEIWMFKAHEIMRKQIMFDRSQD